MVTHILILEDSGERVERFGRVLAKVAPGVAVVVWRDAHQMIRECEGYLATCRLICLDHDLDAVAGGGDPGDGLEVARYLAGLKVGCPILIHSSNGEGARRMLGEFELEGCWAETILPLGAEWIEVYWRGKVERMLGG